MSSAAYAFSSSGQSAPRPKHRPGTHATATSAAADAAIRQIIDRRRKRHKYGGSPEPRPSAVGGVIGTVSEAVGGSIQQLGLPQWTFRAVFVALVAAVLGWAVFVREGVKFHAVDGVLLLEGRPVADATLTFLLPGEAPADGRVFRTDRAGGFRTDAESTLRAGLYTIVVQPPKTAGGKRGTKSAFPPSYTDPATTPLRVQVSENLTGLKLLVRR